MSNSFIDDYEKKIKNNIEKDPYYKEYLTDEDLVSVNKSIEKFARDFEVKNLPIFKSLKGHVARRVKHFAQRSSCRKIAEICFPPEDSRHGVQMDGRDIKRWAAIQLNELFTEQSKSEDGWHWHEY